MDKLIKEIFDTDKMLEDGDYEDSRECGSFSESPWDDVLESIDAEQPQEELEECTQFNKYMDDLFIKEAKQAEHLRNRSVPSLREGIMKYHDRPCNRTVIRSK